MANETRAHEQFRDQVLPSIADWRNDKTKVHRATNVATKLAHMADWYWNCFEGESERVLGQSKLEQFRAKLAETNHSFALIRDMCDADKHMVLRRNDRVLTSAGQFQTGRRGDVSRLEVRWSSPPELIVTDDDGEEHHFGTLVEETEKMWRSMLDVEDD
jgi:hypothetical protein